MASLAFVLRMDDSEVTSYLKDKYGPNESDTTDGDVTITMDLSNDTIVVSDPVDFDNTEPTISLDPRERVVGQLIVQFAEHVARRIAEETDIEWRTFDDEDRRMAELSGNDDLIARASPTTTGKYRIPTVETF